MLTADEKYSCYKSEKVEQAIQMQLSKKRKICYEFFVAFLESTWILQDFEKIDQAHSLAISDIIESKKSYDKNVLNVMF